MSVFNPDRLEALRAMRKMGKSEFAKEAGISRQYYGLLLSRKHKPTVEMIERFAHRFGVDCSYFFTSTGKQTVSL